MATAAMQQDHPLRRHLDSLLTALFGGATLMPWLGLLMQLVCAVAAAISGYATLRRLLWEKQDREARPRLAEKDAEIRRLQRQLADANAAR